MIVTDRFVFLHMPKTGGTFVSAILQRLRAEGLIRCQHESQILPPKHSHARDIPERFRGMWKVVCLRNIVDHYVSHFAYGWWREYPLSFFNNERALDHLSPDDATFSQFIRATNDPAINHWRRDFGPFAEKYGYLSYEWARYLSDDPGRYMEAMLRDPMEALERLRADRYYILRQERLNEDLFAFLCRTGLPPEKLAFVLEHERVRPPMGLQKPRERDWRRYLADGDAAFLLEIEEPVFRFAPDHRIGLDF